MELLIAALESDSDLLGPIAQLVGLTGMAGAYWYHVAIRDPAVAKAHADQISRLVEALESQRAAHEAMMQAQFERYAALVERLGEKK